MSEQQREHGAGEGYRSPIVGDLNIPRDEKTGKEFTTRQLIATGKGPDDAVSMLIELNVLYPGGLNAVRDRFYEVWAPFAQYSKGSYPDDMRVNTEPRVPDGLALVAPKLYQTVISRQWLRRLVQDDQEGPNPPSIHRVWPDYPLHQQIDRSAPTVKANAAWASYGAGGQGIVWAVIDSGIDGDHPHFHALELAEEAAGGSPSGGLTTDLHYDFSYLVQLSDKAPKINVVQPRDKGGRASALIDKSGHGTHVAGIIAGCEPEGSEPVVAVSKEKEGGGFVQRRHVGKLSGMAPKCQLVSLKVMRQNEQGLWVTSSAAVIAALTYLRNEVNVDPAVLRVHGVNMSLGCEWSPEDYASGQSPLCQALNQLVATGVVVVVSAGNKGAAAAGANGANPTAVLGSITEPAHAEDCIAVGSTHREAPYSFGVTWTSGKGPTLDGRMKPDVVAPGEWITSAASGKLRFEAKLGRFSSDEKGRSPAPADPLVGVEANKGIPATPRYAERSGTSMAAPHVSGVIAAFLSARPEFIGKPAKVKKLLMDTATDLGRERYAQGAGLIDLMRMLSNV